MPQNYWSGLAKCYNEDLDSAWKKLWSESVAERTFEGFEPEIPVEEEIVSLGKSIGLVMDERDVNELVEEHSQELTIEELQGITDTS